MIGERKSKPSESAAHPRDENDMTAANEPHNTPESRPTGPPERHTTAVAAEQQEWLRRSLKKLYEDTAQDPIPDTFIALLEELDRKEREGK